MKKILKQATLLLLLSLLFGAGRQFASHGISWTGQWPTESTSALEAYKMMAKDGDPPFISLQDVIEAQRNKTAVLLDARASKLFAQGRIPGSRNLPYYEIEQFQESALAGVQADTPLILYCEGVGCELSFFLGRELQDGGFEEVKIFYGGYPEWSEAGLPIEK